MLSLRKIIIGKIWSKSLALLGGAKKKKGGRNQGRLSSWELSQDHAPGTVLFECYHGMAARGRVSLGGWQRCLEYSVTIAGKLVTPFRFKNWGRCLWCAQVVLQGTSKKALPVVGVPTAERVCGYTEQTEGQKSSSRMLITAQQWVSSWSPISRKRWAWFLKTGNSVEVFIYFFKKLHLIVSDPYQWV